MEIKIEYLISLVKERPVIWNKNLESYKNKALTSAAWKEIFNILNEDFQILSTKEQEEYGKQIQNRWKYLKDSWIRSNRKIMEQVKSGATKFTKKYVYDKEINFLNETIDFDRHDLSARNNSQDPHAGNSSSDCSQLLEKQKNATVSTPTFIKVKRKNFAPIEEVFLNATSNTTDDDTENPRMSFFKSLLPLITNFDDDEMIDFQMEVLGVIRNIKRKRQNQNNLQDPNYSYYIRATSPTNNSNSFHGKLSQSISSPTNSSAISENDDFKGSF